jgi:hypothetical protein
MRRRSGPINPNISRPTVLGRGQQGSDKRNAMNNAATGLLGKGQRTFRGWLGDNGETGPDGWMKCGAKTSRRPTPDASKVKSDK